MSIIDEDTEEFEISNQLDKRPIVLIDSLKRVEKRLFSSQNESIRSSGLNPSPRRASGKKIPPSRENSIIALDSTIEISSGVAEISGKTSQAEMRSRTVVSPLMFESEDETQNMENGVSKTGDSLEIDDGMETKLLDNFPRSAKTSPKRGANRDSSLELAEDMETSRLQFSSDDASSKSLMKDSEIEDSSPEISETAPTESANISRSSPESSAEMSEMELSSRLGKIEESEMEESSNVSRDFAPKASVEENKQGASEIDADTKESVNVSNSSSESSIEMSEMELSSRLGKIDEETEMEESNNVSEGLTAGYRGNGEISEIVEDSMKISRDGKRKGDVRVSEGKMEIQLPDVILTRLAEPLGVTDRRNKYRTRDNRLSAISEAGRSGPVERRDEIREAGDADDAGDPGDGGGGRGSGAGVKSVFLKPGKSWARSLSILNRIQDEEDLEALSAGKGKNWRQSVISVLNMQSQGLVQCCISKNENGAPLRASRTSRATEDERKWSRRLTSRPSSPGRFIRRVSVRVVPELKGKQSIDKVQDSSFLEAYGITTSKDRRTLVQKSISPVRKSSYKLRNAPVDVRVSQPVTTPRNVVLARCNQSDSLPFSQFYSEEYLDHCRKIGEGVYGEVFLFDDKRERSVIKIIPIEGLELVNGEPQKKFEEILSEIIISKELHNLRVNDTHRTDGFIEVKNIRCLVGKYPERLLELWRAYDEEKRSENDCPSMFEEEQLYIALELGDGGQDLEGFVFQNASEAYSALIQTTLTLAVAEKALDFEHRDLHWGNILISRTNEKEMTYKLDNHEIKFPCQGIKVSIIDFTLSRMSYEGCCIFTDLALDPSLFTAVGDYQFEIYRLMKAMVENDWQVFEPHTNIQWLHYILGKMTIAVRYKRKGTKIHNNYIQRLQSLQDVIMDYESASEFVTKCDSVKAVLQFKLTN